MQAFTITQDADGIALKLSVSQPSAAPILIFASRPYNAGRRYCDKFHYIGTLPPPDGGECDITVQYVKVYPQPQPNSRVILQLVQQIDGWRDLLHRFEAIFRPIPPLPPPPAHSRATLSTP